MSARIVHADDPRYLKAAFSVLGLSEIAGEEDEPQILAMYAACGHPEVRRDEVAWCAAYVGWSLHRGGLPNTSSLLAISYAGYPGRRFSKADTIPRGAICVWPRTGGNHVNFALADLGDTLLCIGGNQGNGRGGGVTITRTPKHLLKAAVLPEGTALPRPRPKPPLEAPEPEKPKKTGVSDLRKLLPVRPSDEPNCPDCDGTGIFGRGELKDLNGQPMSVGCSGCWGLGWHAIPPARSP